MTELTAVYECVRWTAGKLLRQTKRQRFREGHPALSRIHIGKAEAEEPKPLHYLLLRPLIQLLVGYDIGGIRPLARPRLRKGDRRHPLHARR